MKLDELRKQIDETDEALLRLFEQRMELAGQIGAYKWESGLPICDSTREREKLAAITALAQDKNKQAACELYSLLFQLSKTRQRQFASGLLGEQLSHSYSKQLHAMLGNDSYRLYEVAPENLAQFLNTEPFDGLNVTIPYKKAVLPYCDELSEEARMTGNVNTLVRKNGKILGYNTDCYGFETLLRKTGLQLSGCKALVLGSGGASESVQYVLQKYGARVTVISRSGENTYENLEKHADAQLIVNATPVGMFPNTGERPLQIGMFSQCEAVIDLIYNPARTKLLLDAERCGIAAFNGLTMLAAQAVRTEELFTGQKIATEQVEQLCTQLERLTCNVILIGMPGSGKTAIGKQLAALTKREFLDCDTAMEQTAGRTVPDILARDGERAFRELETQTLRMLCKQSGKVIATGGGVVTSAHNLDILRQNGRLVFLDRPLAELPTDGRPVSQKNGVAALAAARLPLYRTWADCTVAVNGVEQTADAIRRELAL